MTLYFLSKNVRIPVPHGRGFVMFIPWLPEHPCVCSFTRLIIASFCGGFLCSVLGQKALPNAAKWKRKNNSLKSNLSVNVLQEHKVQVRLKLRQNNQIPVCRPSH